MTIKIYRILLFIFYPFLCLYLFIRKRKGKEDKNRINERFGKTTIKRPEGRLIWFNAVSVGEINSAWSIIRKINENNNVSILLTTTSITSANSVKIKMAKLPNPDKVIHQFAPIDACMGRFLKHWKPNLLINIESEFWPNLFTKTKKVCPIIVLNGKMSKKSFRFWYKHKKLKEMIFDSIDICLAQSRNDYKRFINLGAQNVQFIGNIKFFVDKCDIDTDLYNSLSEEIKDRKRWLVNCTHEGEEKIIIKVHELLKQKYKDLITTLIIRHPERTVEVCDLLNKNSIKYVTNSSGKKVNNDTEFYVYDKFGNLGTFFELNKIVFIAGSLQKGIGGHTPAEAIKHGCCVVSGPYMENNYALFKDLLNDKACIVIENNRPETLFKTIDELFSDGEKVARISNNSYRKSLQHSVVLKQIIDIIEKECGL